MYDLWTVQISLTCVQLMVELETPVHKNNLMKSNKPAGDD